MFASANRATAQVPADVLPPHEIMTIVRSTGIEPISRPSFRGTTYVLQGYDDSDELVRVIVDARSGRLLSIRPIIAVGPSYTRFPPVSVREPFGPRVVYGGGYDEFAPFPRGPMVRPPGPVNGQRPPAAKSAAIKPAQPPLPRPRPTELAAKPAPATQPAVPATQAAAAPPKAAAEPPTGSLASRRDAPSPAKPAGPEFPPVQPLE